MAAADAAVRRIERLMLLHTVSLWGVLGSVLLTVAAATQLKGLASDVLGDAGMVAILLALLMFLAVLIAIAETIKHTWAGWFAESVLFGPVGILIAYFSARSAAREAIQTIRNAPVDAAPAPMGHPMPVQATTDEDWRDRWDR